MRGNQRGKWYNGRDMSKYREAEDILDISCNKEITREKSIRKEVRCKQI